MELDIVNNESESRFEAYVDGLLTQVKYTKSANGQLIITSTQVPKELEGRGIAGIITKYALEYAKEHGLKVNPVCSYTATYIKRHAEYNDLLEKKE